MHTSIYQYYTNSINKRYTYYAQQDSYCISGASGGFYICMRMLPTCKSGVDYTKSSCNSKNVVVLCSTRTICMLIQEKLVSCQTSNINITSNMVVSYIVFIDVLSRYFTRVIQLYLQLSLLSLVFEYTWLFEIDNLMRK